METGQEGPEVKAETTTTSSPLLRSSRSCSCLSVGSSWWQRFRKTTEFHQEPRWWIRAILKIREWSEIVAGPRWKTFIRQFNSDRRLGRKWDDNAKYDPMSYKLNFKAEEEDNNDDDEVGFGGFRSFSVRYASASVAYAKSPAVK